MLIRKFKFNFLSAAARFLGAVRLEEAARKIYVQNNDLQAHLFAD